MTQNDDIDIINMYEHVKQLHKDEYISIYDASASTRIAEVEKKNYFYSLELRMLEFVIPKGKRILCICSDVGEYLHRLEPSYGVGVELSEALVEQARQKYPQYRFIHACPENFVPEEEFDYVILPYAVNGLFDVQKVMENIQSACNSQTRIIFIWYNFLWKPLCQIAEWIGLKQKSSTQNWFSRKHIEQLLTLSDFQSTRMKYGIVFPYYIPVLSWFLNVIIASLPVFQTFCLMNMLVARSVKKEKLVRESLPSVSVIIPCKNEYENIRAAVVRTPQMGSRTELIFCDDKSTDGTAEQVLAMQKEFPDKNIRLEHGPGISKSHNVWTGFNAAEGDILMILDADLTMPPEELPRFYDAIVSGKGEFINGTRLVYPLRDQAMRLANIVGNKFFSLAFSYILGDYISDTLCGTKVLWRSDWEKIKTVLGTWGIVDRWGDYELIFGSARLGKKHLELPVHYLERLHGETKMTGRLKNGWIMLKMCWAAYKKFK